MKMAAILRLFRGRGAFVSCAFALVFFFTGWQASAQSVSDTNEVVSTNQTVSTSGPTLPPFPTLPPPPPPPVLTNPPPGVVPQFPSFSAQPTTGEIIHARIFSEPLIPCDGSPYTYDNLGRITQDTLAQNYGTYTYSYFGNSSRVASIAYPYGGVSTTFGYYNTNGDLRLMGLTNFTGSRFNYSYNKEGQITNVIEQLAAGALRTNGYAYDAIGELINVTTNGNTNAFNYSYDLAGNRTMEQQGTNIWRARFNPLNGLQSKDQGLSSTNRIYQWDEENRLVSITESNLTATMIYNGFGHLAYLTEENNGSPTMYHWYVWDGNKVAEESYENTSGST